MSEVLELFLININIVLQNCILPWKTEVRNCTSAYDAPCYILIKTKKNWLLIFIQ